MQTLETRTVEVLGDVEIHGLCGERFARVQDAFAATYWGGNGGSMAFVDLDRAVYESLRRS